MSFPERDNVNKRVFRGVKMSVAISLFQKRIKTKLSENSFTVKTYAEKQMRNEFSIELTVEDIKKVYPNRLIVPMAKGSSWELLKKFNSTKNQIKFKAQAGEIDMTKYSEYFDSTDGLRVYTGAQILRYSTTENPSQGEVIYLPSKYIPETEKAKARYKSRLVLQRITGVDSKLRLIVAKIPKDSLCANSTNFILFENKAYQLFSLGVLNSKLINYIFKITSTNTNITTSELNRLPLPNYSEKIEKIVKTILEKKNQNEATLLYENEIDIIVYRLYGLTYQEVLIIDPTFSLTQEEYDNYNI